MSAKNHEVGQKKMAQGRWCRNIPKLQSLPLGGQAIREAFNNHLASEFGAALRVCPSTQSASRPLNLQSKAPPPGTKSKAPPAGLPLGALAVPISKFGELAVPISKSEPARKRDAAKG